MSDRRRAERTPLPDLPIFSERLTSVLEEYIAGKAPNVGRFCGFCYTPMDPQRMHCLHCRKSVADYAPADRFPRELLEMFRRVRRRESLVVNGFAYLGLFLGVVLFIGIFYAIFTLGGGVGWYVFDIVFLFVAARVLAGLIGGFVGDELGFRYARRKLAEEWQAYETEREAGNSATEATTS